MAFLAELKRRRVGKVAIGYGAIAWAVTESMSVVLPALRVPDWAMTMIVVFLLVGFPIAMVLAWVFDATSQGIQRTEPLPEEVTDTGKRLRVRAAYGAMVLFGMAGLGYLLYERGLGRAQAGRTAQFDCGTAVYQPEWRRQQGLFQRRHVRGVAQPAGARAWPAGRVAHVGLCVQGPQRRYPRGGHGTRRRNGARGQRAPGGRPGAHHGAAHRHRDRVSISGPKRTTASSKTFSRYRTKSRRPSSTG